MTFSGQPSLTGLALRDRRNPALACRAILKRPYRDSNSPAHALPDDAAGQLTRVCLPPPLVLLRLGQAPVCLLHPESKDSDEEEQCGGYWPKERHELDWEQSWH